MPGRHAAVASPIQAYLETLHGACESNALGAVADYIPELADADPSLFGICVATVDGRVYEVGDTRQTFTIQSISKPLTYGLALADRGREHVIDKVGVEPSGDAFNAISLAPDTGRPANPMINAGAITAASLIDGPDPEQRLVHAYSEYAGRELHVDHDVYTSERDTGHRNRAISHLLRNFGILEGDPERALDLYFRQCSVLVDARDLSVMAATLANGGRNPLTGRRVLAVPLVERVLSVMTTCGMYDGAGDWVDGVGLPAKSGVAGGVIAVLPGQIGIGIFSPPLNEHGNSTRGVEVCRRMSRELELHFLRASRSPWTAVRATYDMHTRPSKRLRPPADRLELEALAPRGIVYELHGDLLFGATEAVVRGIVDRCDTLDAVAIDLRRVARIGAPAAQLLLDLHADVTGTGRVLVFVGTQTRALLGEPEEDLTIFEDLDHATEFCEDHLLGLDGGDRREAADVTLPDHSLCAGLSAEDLATLEALLEPRAFDAGDELVAAGAVAEHVSLLMAGEVSILARGANAAERRLATLSPGATFGELAVLGRVQRSATVRADTDGELLILTSQAFDSAPPTLQAALLRNLLGGAHEMVQRLTREVTSLA